MVPRGVILFRMIPTAAHTEEDVDLTLGAFRKMRDEMRLDPLRRNPRGEP